ncbi:MAG TPA: lysozyme inhibitor LprI family protein [Acetobacteraceae bacterium]|nr:lysozyme inhibitor LprI family protein [Acetobacteraceae bacterium]
MIVTHRTPSFRLKAATAIALLLLTWVASRADEADPIDAALQTCLASSRGETTAGMVDCTGAAIHAWDGRLSETYGHALAALDPESRALLQAAQQRWLAFRAAEHAAWAGPWQADRGSLIRVQIMNAELSAIKERVNELRLFLPSD